MAIATATKNGQHTVNRLPVEAGKSRMAVEAENAGRLAEQASVDRAFIMAMERGIRQTQAVLAELKAGTISVDEARTEIRNIPSA